MENANDNAFVLRHSVQPYVGFAVIFAGLTIFGAFTACKLRDFLGFFEVITMIWMMFVLVVFIGTRYRVLWSGDKIIMKTSGAAAVVIGAQEITQIRFETGLTAGMRRPLRRIAIYADQSRGEAKFIDISLKHFVRGDILKLLHKIKGLRSDLILPPHWS